eukprot:9468145-Pyramimonas_sp.AAC.2
MLGLFTPGCQRGRLAGVDSWRVLAEQLLGNPVLVCPYGGALVARWAGTREPKDGAWALKPELRDMDGAF